MLTIIGGSYLENCIDPSYRELYGSGLRAAAALSNKGFEIFLHSCIGKKYESMAILKSHTYGYECSYVIGENTTEFEYYHPLSFPIINFDEDVEHQEIDNIKGEYILYYGMLEANARFSGNYVVYDPQNHISFKETGSSAKHLAIVLNRNEALMLSGINSTNLEEVGKRIIKSENAEVLVIKNGAHGALIFENEKVSEIPVFETDSVWPIGTGDIFSAVFSWKWMIEQKNAFESAYLASQYTAQYAQSRHLPLIRPSSSLKELKVTREIKNIYLAGPFFTIAERWLINEIRNTLIEFGNNVFSPLHDVGVYEIGNNLNAKKIADKDIEGLKRCDTILAVVSGLDAGTLFEIGYARSLNKKVVILSQNVNENDLIMLIGTNCEITEDLSTAIYKASW